LIEARAAIEGLLKRVRELEEELVFERLHKPAAAQTKAAKPAPDDRRIASLMKKSRELRAKLRRMHQFYEDESSRKGIMAFSTYGKLMKCLHPDSKPSDAEPGTPPRLRRIAEHRRERFQLAWPGGPHHGRAIRCVIYLAGPGRTKPNS
jgi:hypothetical protein